MRNYGTRLTDQSVDRNTHNYLCYARARLLEQEKRYENAFDAFREANLQRSIQCVTNFADKQNGARTVINDLTRDVIDRYSGHGNKSDRPVFIVGMPRSGTTLTEQILAAQPDVYAAAFQYFVSCAIVCININMPDEETLT